MHPLVLTRNLLKRNIVFFWEHRAREAQVASQIAYLNSFDDRLLSDIGLSRCEIEAHVRRQLGQKVSEARS